MTRQEAYVAELSQLLFYMTPWDKAEALKNVNKLFAETENEAELLNELGTPMKLAVTLHRGYEPTPEPTPEELAAREAAEAAAAREAEAAEEEAAEEAAEEESEVVEEAAEEKDEAAEEAAEEESEAVEEAAEEELEAAEEAAEEKDEAAEEAAEEKLEAVEEAAEEESEAVEEAVEEESEAVEEAAEEESEVAEEAAEEESEVAEETAEEVRTPWVIEEGPEKEKIFAEIFNAATEAQSAVVKEEDIKPVTKRKARYLLLIPYTLFALLVGIPGTFVFAVANIAVTAAAVVSLVAMVYLVIFHLFAAVTLGSKLILFGLSVVMLSLSIILAVFALWFLHNATLGFPRFLREVAMKHCYREVEVK